MMLRSLVLFVHIAAMLVLFGGLGVEWLILGILGRSKTEEQAAPWLSVSAALPRAIGIAVGLILFSGIYLAVRLNVYDSGWVLVSFGSMVLMAILGGPVIRLRMNAIRQSGGVQGSHASDPLVRASLFIRVAVGLAVVYLMIGKPGLGESLLLTGAAFALGGAMSRAWAK
jgi:hypothetical protein